MKVIRNIMYFITKSILRIFVKRPKYYFLGDFDLDSPAIYMSNHRGATGPISNQLYFPINFRFWGTHEMSTTVKKRYNYLVNTFFYQGWKIKFKPICHILACIATPFVSAFYSYAKVIPTYEDNRLLTTYKESIKTLVEHKESIFIFPEDISNGYFDEVVWIHSGYYLLGERCLKKDVDLPIYLMYLNKKQKTVAIDKPIMFSTILNSGKTKDEISQYIKNRINELAKMTKEHLEKIAFKISTLKEH